MFSGSKVRVGADTLLAAYVYIVGGDHDHSSTEVAPSKQQRLSAGIDVGKNCWLGAGARILDGVTVGADSIVGANAVVSKDVPEYSIAAGIPAKVLRDRRDPPD